MSSFIRIIFFSFGYIGCIKIAMKQYLKLNSYVNNLTTLLWLSITSLVFGLIGCKQWSIDLII